MHEDLGLSFSVEHPLGRGLEQDQISWMEDFQNQNTQRIAGEKKITVVLLGWSGAKDKQLAKYSDIYLKMGYIVVRCVIPAKVTYSDVARLPLIASEILSNMREHYLNSHPIFFHTFSNGGALLYSYVIREIGFQTNPDDFDVRGTIFDSGPCAPTCTSAYRAIKITCRSYTLFGMDLGSVIAALVVFVAMIRVFWTFNKLAWECFSVGTFKRLSKSHGREEKYPLSEFLQRIWKLKNHSFAFLYSEADVITPWEEVELIASVIRNRGNPVKLVKFQGSGHVLHYRMHPEEYTSAITKFISSSMESYTGPAVYWDE